MKRNIWLSVALACSMLSACGTSSPVQDEVAPLRLLNHWDNPDGTVERGYAGRSLFWGRGFIDTLLVQEYGQRNQAIGINGTVLNNVNASPCMLTDAYLDTTATYADLLRPYGLRVYLAVNFATPLALGETDTADPLHPDVIQWWRAKAAEIYRRIPDFGGFLVKANSEGQPGPCDFGRTHAEGANMLASALKEASTDGVVIWRSFVYSPSDPDRAKQAYIEFAQLDGQFADNVIIQIKNGPIDFQPREPISPLFFAMPHTRLMAELQITQEYLGHANHIVWLGPMWTEFIQQLNLGGRDVRDFAGVANIGVQDERLSYGNALAEQNSRTFGLLASDPSLSSEALLEASVQSQFPNMSDATRAGIRNLLSASREAVVDYMMPLGLHHLFAWGHHYGPEPWCSIPGARPDWMPSYYHRADSAGLGFDRTAASGSGATQQYPDTMRRAYEPLDDCPEQYLLWFHHVGWDYTRRWSCCDTTETLWQHLGRHYQRGVDKVSAMKQQWNNMQEAIEPSLWRDIADRLECQHRDAIWWRDACLLYFQQFSHQPWPEAAAQPCHKLEDLQRVRLGISNYECPSIGLLDSQR